MEASGTGVLWPGAPWVPRRWQAEALDAVLQEVDGGKRTIIAAVMGSGKSILIAELAARRLVAGDQTVLVTTPTMALVDQLAGTLRERLGDAVVGRYFTHAKESNRPVIVACNSSATTVGEAVAGINRQVDTWIADEVHKTETGKILAAYESIKPTRAIGLTATPYRSDEREKLSLWESVAYRYSLGQALEDRVLVPWRVKSWDGKGTSEDLDDVCWTMIHEACGPGMINASNIDDAEEFANKLRAEGWSVGTVHSRKRREENQEIIDQLHAENLRAVVHVNMLAEGVDMPWLRWLCLRRPVGAKVRFLQEVGRVLRASPEKSEAVLYDPHGLFSVFGWHYTEALGEWEAAASTGKTCSSCKYFDRNHNVCHKRDISVFPGSPACKSWEHGVGGAGDGPARTATAIDPISSWCRRILLPLQADGLSPSDKIASLVWRRDRPSSEQLTYLAMLNAKAPWQYLPEPHRGLVPLAISGGGASLTRGAASDLISIAKAVAKHKRYPDGIEVEPVSRDVLEGRAAISVVDDIWYSAAGYKKNGKHVALVVFHGGRVIESKVREKTIKDGWIDIQLEAAAMAYVASGKRGRVGMDVEFAAKMASGAIPTRSSNSLQLVTRLAGSDIVTVKDTENQARSMCWRVLSRAEKT